MDQKMIDALRVISSVPQTQADINELARTAAYAQTPEFRAALLQVESQAKNFAYVHLALQVGIAAIAMATFLVLLRREQRSKKG